MTERPFVDVIRKINHNATMITVGPDPDGLCLISITKTFRGEPDGRLVIDSALARELGKALTKAANEVESE